MNNSSEPSSDNFQIILIDMSVAGFVIIINVATIIVTLSIKSTDERLTTVITSLSVADALVGLARIIKVIWLRYTPMEGCHFGEGLFIGLCTYFPGSVSQLHVVVLSVDRYLAVQYALTYSSMVTPRRLKLMVLSAWIIGALETLIIHVFHHLECLQGNIIFQQVWRILPVCQLCIIMMINAVIYTKLWFIARKHRRSISNMESRFHTGLSVTSNKANIMVLIIVVLFMLLWSPYVVTNIIIVSSNNLSAGAIMVQDQVGVLGYANSVVNSFVYVVLNKQIREVMRKTCQCKS